MYYCFVLQLFLTMALSSVQTAEILNFSQSTDAVAPGGNITFICEVIGRSAEWKINDTFRYQSDPTRGFFIINVPIRNDTISDYLLLRLTITAYEYNNSSKISCFGFDPNTQQDKLFIIAGPPSEPQPRFSYTDNGLSLTITWNKPFTHTGFNITAYSLLIYNTSDSTMRNVTLGQQRMYVDVIDTAPSNCHELQYTVTVYNSLGSNAASVIAGYPIPLDPVEIQWRVLYDRDSAPHLEIWFEPAYVCSFQDVEYTVYLENVSGNSTLQTYGDVLYSVHSGLSVGANYTVIIEEQSTVGLTVSRQDIVIEALHSQTIKEQSTVGPVSIQDVEALPSQSIGNQQVQIHITAIGGLAVCLAVSLVLFFIFLALYCKQRKKAKYLRKISVDTANNGRPSTLRTRSSATKLNPIYEGGGPVYESPGGEPLRVLLSTSTPSTPNTPLDNNNPRYVFDTPPPDIPPPRKLQFVLPNAPSCNGGNLEKDQEKADLKVALEEPEYTMMRPIQAVKPSPLILST